MFQLAAIFAIPVLAAFGLGYLAAKWRCLNRIARAEELAQASHEDGLALAQDLRGLQAALADGFPVEPSELAPPRMPRTQEVLLAATARDLRRSWPQAFRLRRLVRRVEHTDSQI